MYKKIADRDQVQVRAAVLAAKDELSDTQIAQQCSITRRTLIRWKKNPGFQSKVAEHLRLNQLDSWMRRISHRQEQLESANQVWQRLQELIRARGNSPEMAHIPGGTTGLLRRRKVFGSQQQKGRKLAADYELDRVVLQTMRRLEVAASKATGQWQRPLVKEEIGAYRHTTPLAIDKQERAATLAAGGQVSDTKIAAACGIDRRTLGRWRRQARFCARVIELRADFEGSGRGLASLSERLKVLDWRWHLLLQLFEERGFDSEMLSEPGGRNGRMNGRRRLVGQGRSVITYYFDKHLLAELRKHEAQAANELGQWGGGRRSR
jgi:hypothetical protein